MCASTQRQLCKLPSHQGTPTFCKPRNVYNISIFQRNNAGGHLSFTHSKASPGRHESLLIKLQGASHSSGSASLKAVCFKSPPPTVCVVLVPTPCAGREVCLHSLFGTFRGIFESSVQEHLGCFQPKYCKLKFANIKIDKHCRAILF